MSGLGGGEHLARIQKTLLLGIEEIGCKKERSGDSDHQEVIAILSDLLKQCMLGESQLNIAIGRHAYAGKN